MPIHGRDQNRRWGGDFGLMDAFLFQLTMTYLGIWDLRPRQDSRSLACQTNLDRLKSDQVAKTLKSAKNANVNDLFDREFDHEVATWSRL